MENHMEQEIKTILADQFGIEADSISNDMCIINDLNSDSLDDTEIIVAVEKKYKIAIDPEEFTETTVQFLLDLATKKAAKKKAKKK
jgi:acyl carrier protein